MVAAQKLPRVVEERVVCCHQSLTKRLCRNEHRVLLLPSNTSSPVQFFSTSIEDKKQQQKRQIISTQKTTTEGLIFRTVPALSFQCTRDTPQLRTQEQEVNSSQTLPLTASKNFKK